MNSVVDGVFQLIKVSKKLRFLLKMVKLVKVIIDLLLARLS